MIFYKTGTEHLQDKSSTEATKMAFTVEVEMALLTISETRKDVKEEEQLALSCCISPKTRSSKWASTDSKYLLHERKDLFDRSLGHKRVAEMINPTDQVEMSLESKLCHIVPAKNSSEMCSTVFNREYEAVNSISKTVYNKQYDASMQCREVEEQVGIAMTHLAYCLDSGKQMQIVVYMVRDQGVFNKTT
jgi:hypothetical protein